MLCEDLPENARAGEQLTLKFTVRNDGEQTLSPAGQHRVSLTHRWLMLDGTWVASPDRIPLPAPLEPSQTAELELTIEVPKQRGPSYLRVSLVQEGICFFDDVSPGNGLRATVYATV